MARKRKPIVDDTWDMIYPFLKPYLPKIEEEPTTDYPKQMNTNQKILLDAFFDIPESDQERVVREVVDLARKELKRRNESTD